jgi:hypothetical protein
MQVELSFFLLRKTKDWAEIVPMTEPIYSFSVCYFHKLYCSIELLNLKLVQLLIPACHATTKHVKSYMHKDHKVGEWGQIS